MIFLSHDRFQRYCVGCFDLLREQERNARFRMMFLGYGKIMLFVVYNELMAELWLLLRCGVSKNEFAEC